MAKKNIDLSKLNSKKTNNELENLKIINSNLRTQVSPFILLNKDRANQNVNAHILFITLSSILMAHS